MNLDAIVSRLVKGGEVQATKTGLLIVKQSADKMLTDQHRQRMIEKFETIASPSELVH